MSAFYSAQQQAYLQPGSAGWFMWTLKMENGGIWSLESCYTQVSDASLCCFHAKDYMSRAGMHVTREGSMLSGTSGSGKALGPEFAFVRAGSGFEST